MNKDTLRLSVVGLGIIVGGFIDEAPPPDYGVECWEDEVVVEVVHDPYDLTDTAYGCVAADNLPVVGFRPDGNESHVWDPETNTIIHE